MIDVEHKYHMQITTFEYVDNTYLPVTYKHWYQQDKTTQLNQEFKTYTQYWELKKKAGIYKWKISLVDDPMVLAGKEPHASNRNICYSKIVSCTMTINHIT